MLFYERIVPQVAVDDGPSGSGAGGSVQPTLTALKARGGASTSSSFSSSSFSDDGDDDDDGGERRAGKRRAAEGGADGGANDGDASDMVDESATDAPAVSNSIYAVMFASKLRARAAERAVRLLWGVLGLSPVTLCTCVRARVCVDGRWKRGQWHRPRSFPMQLPLSMGGARKPYQRIVSLCLVFFSF